LTHRTRAHQYAASDNVIASDRTKVRCTLWAAPEGCIPWPPS